MYDLFIDANDWFTPCLVDQQSIPRNFKMAVELTHLVSIKPDLEFLFYNFVTNEFIIVEPIDSLYLMSLTIESDDQTRYITTAIDIEMWNSLNGQLIYVCLV
jgi:hypothetical protein